MYKLQKKFGKYAIRDLITYLIYISIAVYVVQLIQPSAINYLYLNPQKVLQGEIWRIITFIFIPAVDLNILFALLGFMFMYYLSKSLENIWGAFRTNIYILICVLLTLIVSFLFMIPIYSSFLIYDSLFLAFAYEFPNQEIRIYFVLPIKIKYIAMVRVAFMIYSLIVGGFSARIIVFLTVANFLVFYAPEIIGRMKNKGHVKIKKTMYDKKINGAKKDTMHKCEVCKMTEKDDPNMEFRYCSKCNGSYEYCANHLFTHNHKQ